jgi:hypothetical protein
LLEKVLRESFESYMRGVHVAIPATVISFDAKNQTAKINIDILEQIGEENKSIATLEDVPFAFARSGGFVITFPVNIGDKVQLLFQHRSIDKWLIDGERNSKDLRTHNINDSIASNLIAYPLNSAIDVFSSESMMLRTLDNKIYIKMKSDSIEFSVKDNCKIFMEDEKITIDAKDVEINADVKINGKLTVAGLIKSLKDVVAVAVSLLLHIHGGVKGGSSTTSPPK